MTHDKGVDNSTMIQDGSFLRLKNIKFTYDLAIKKSGVIDGLTLFLAGSNLFVLTNFSGFDPEAGGSIRSAEYPTARTVTAGIHFKLAPN